MPQLPTSQQLVEISSTIIESWGRYGEDYLVIYCRQFKHMRRNDNDHIMLARRIKLDTDVLWNFLALMNWCLRTIYDQECEEKLAMIFSLNIGAGEETETKLDLFNNLSKVIEWLRPIIERYDARMADLHNVD